MYRLQDVLIVGQAAKCFFWPMFNLAALLFRLVHRGNPGGFVAGVLESPSVGVMRVDTGTVVLTWLTRTPAS